MNLASVAFVPDIKRQHVARCLAMLSARNFPNATDEARRVIVVEKLKAELAVLDTAQL